MTDFTDNENSLGSSPNDTPEGSKGTTQGNENAAAGSKVDPAHKEADKPIQPNTDVDGAKGPMKTT